MGSVGCAPRAAPWVLPGVCLFCFNVPLRPDEARHCGDSSYRPAGHSPSRERRGLLVFLHDLPPSSWEWIPPRKTKAILQRYDPSHSYADLLSTSTYVCDDSQLVAQAVGINSCVALLPCATQHLGHCLLEPSTFSVVWLFSLFRAFTTAPQWVCVCTPGQQGTGRGFLGTASQPTQEWQNKDGCFGTIHQEIHAMGSDGEE